MALSHNSGFYRVYKSGWCEQGGLSAVTQTDTNITVTLLKNYIDTDYTILLTSSTGNNNATIISRMTYDQTKSSFKYRINHKYNSAGSPNGATWRTTGYVS